MTKTNHGGTMKITHVVGARPNFMKVAPVIAALKEYPQVSQLLVHTGQHYDRNMSDIFFRQLGIPEPDINLEVGSASHAQQTAQIMSRFEEVILEHKPDVVCVYGDINSTMAASLVCAKLLVPVAHVEAGLRSFDNTMPEEINRLVTDRLANWLFTPSADGDRHLQAEGVDMKRVHLVGNVMIDTLIRLLSRAVRPQIDNQAERYALVTLHRPSNVDDPLMLSQILDTLRGISQSLQVVFPVHPRTRKRIEDFDVKLLNDPRFIITEPVGYLEFLALQRDATMVITDSGGIQEETTYLGVPCLTLRENTERPITIDVGTNILIGHDMNLLREHVDKILQGKAKKGAVPPLWDGKAGARIAEILVHSAGDRTPANT